MVGSGCESEVIVRKASESRIVGGWQACERVTEVRAKRGSWERGGMSMVAKGVHLYLRKSSFRFCVICSQGHVRKQQII